MLLLFDRFIHKIIRTLGAKSLVKGEIPENAIVVGVPAKAKKYRT